MAPSQRLTFVLSIIAGSVDAIGFLGLGGVFIAHITGNIVILAARLLAGDPAPVAHILSVPVFVVVLFLTSLAANRLARVGIVTLGPLLLLQTGLLAAASATAIAAGSATPDARPMILAAMLGASAMAVQNALVRASLKGSPATAVMTTNVTTFTINLVEMLFAPSAGDAAQARDHARTTGAAIGGFLLGCGAGAICEAELGLVALILPTVLSLLSTVGALWRAQSIASPQP